MNSRIDRFELSLYAVIALFTDDVLSLRMDAFNLVDVATFVELW